MTDKTGDDTTDPAGGEAGRIQSLDEMGRRLDAQESKLDTLIESVSKLVPGSHAEAQQRTEDRLDRPSTVEEQVQAELARAREAQARADADQAAATERETMAQRLAKLEEKPPAEPARRATQLLGWGRG